MLIFSKDILPQNYSIEGRVIDKKQNPILGVNVIISSTNLGDATDENGNYEIENLLPGVYKIEFSAIGYDKIVKENITIANSSITLDVVLSEKIILSEEVVVTAGKYEQKFYELPVSAEIISGREIQKNYFNIEDAFRNTPGLNMTEEQISVRGSSGYSKGAGTRVLVTLDGVPLYTGDTGEIIWEGIPITDIERIEVLKGPASSLYGSTAIGGVINIITKKSTSKGLTYIKAYGGAYDNPSYDEWKWQSGARTFYETTITHSNSFKELGYTLSLKKFNDDGYRKDDFKQRLLGYIKLNYDFSPISSISLIANYLHMNRGNFLYWKDSRNVLIQREEDQNKTVESDRLFTSLIYKQGLSDKVSAEFKSSYYYSKFVGRGIEITSSNAGLFRNEFLMNFKLPHNIFLISGIELSYAKVNSNIFSNPEFFTGAGYAQAEYKGIPDLVATLGLRYDYIKIEKMEGANAYTPKAGINYYLFDNLIWRGSFGTGFRAPTPAEVFTSTDVGMGISVKENLNLKPETSISFETGLKYLPTSNLSLDLALFHTNYHNFIETELTDNNTIQLVNIVDAKIEGLEFVSTFSIIPNMLQLSAGYTYLNTLDTKLNTALKYRPKHLVYTYLEFTPAPFEFKVDYRYWSEVEEIDYRLVDLGLVQDGELKVPGHVLDFRAGYNFSIGSYYLNLFASVKNLLNYNYIETVGNLRTIRNYSLGLNLFL
ncbi:MAG: TonB-dependent receptor [Ignavibacterium sp.]|jgi:iron complex outermembrane receptor protein|nr:TonB-dependent receptor [Ignavibacterium sp.]